MLYRWEVALMVVAIIIIPILLLEVATVLYQLIFMFLDVHLLLRRHPGTEWNGMRRGKAAIKRCAQGRGGGFVRMGNTLSLKYLYSNGPESAEGIFNMTYEESSRNNRRKEYKYLLLNEFVFYQILKHFLVHITVILGAF